jgi:hypothetical protein
MCKAEKGCNAFSVPNNRKPTSYFEYAVRKGFKEYMSCGLYHNCAMSQMTANVKTWNVTFYEPKSARSLGCYHTASRGKLGWKYVGVAKTKKQADSMCGSTWKYVSLECSRAVGFEVWCLNSPSNSVRPMSDCQGLTSQTAKHCSGPYYRDNMWTGSGTAGVLSRNSQFKPDKQLGCYSSKQRG